MFERVVSFVGEDNLKRIKNTSVLIVGLGGVGGYAMEALARSGIGKLIIIDFDKIDESNLNRQIITNTNNIGNLKVDEAKKRIKMINPNCEVISYNLFLEKDNMNILDMHHIDYIVDACDSVPTKKLLIDYALDNDIKLIASMGTANKLDPTKLEIIDIRKTAYDPLAKILRKYVLAKKDVLASLVFVPATAGLLCANYIIKDIINI